MNAWKVILATLVIFGTGVVTGGLLVTYVDRSPQHRRRPVIAESTARNQTNAAGRETSRGANLPNPIPPLLRKDFLQNLDREVRLTPEQHEQIEKIMSEGQELTRQLWDGIAPQLRREMAEVKERIRLVLTPEQRVRFEALMKQHPREGRRAPPPHEGVPPESTTPSPPPATDTPRNL